MFSKLILSYLLVTQVALAAFPTPAPSLSRRQDASALPDGAISLAVFEETTETET